MAKKKAKEVAAVAPAKPVKLKKGFDIKVRLEKGPAGDMSNKERLKVTVVLFEDGVEIASDYDFVNLD